MSIDIVRAYMQSWLDRDEARFLSLLAPGGLLADLRKYKTEGERYPACRSF